MNFLSPIVPRALLALIVMSFMVHSPLAAAQEQTSTTIIHLYNRTCGPISVVVLDNGNCPKGTETCQISIDYGKRADIQMTGALPPALVYQVNGQCQGSQPTRISGQCEIVHLKMTPKHAGKENSSLGQSMDTPCRSLSGECTKIEGGSIRNKLVKLRYRSADIELGLCDKGADGVDNCQIQCKVR